MDFWIVWIDLIFHESIWKEIFIVFLIIIFQSCIFFQPLLGLLLQWIFLSRFLDVATCWMTSSTLFIGFTLCFQVGFEMETMGGKAKENMKFAIF
jgi:hypothetical protein